MRWMVLWAVIAEVVIIAIGCNQWVSKKVIHYAGAVPQPGFAHQFAYSTQTFAWRLTKASRETTSQWLAPLALIAVVLVVTALLVAFLLRVGSFWRAAIGSLVIVVVATQLGAIAGGLVFAGPIDVGYTSYAPLSNNGIFYGGGPSDGSTLGVGGGRATVALFDSPTGYRFVGGIVLGLLVGLVVGIVAYRLRDVTSDAPAAPPLWPSQAFFPPGNLQRTYEANTAPPLPPPLAAPGALAERLSDYEPPGSGRHSLD